MIIVKLWGGIGNQLFQWVFGQYLHHKYNQEVRYDLKSYITTDHLRKSEVGHLDTEILTIPDYKCRFSQYRGIKNRMMILQYCMNPRHHFIREGSELPDHFKSKHEYFLQGYWQDYKYIKWLRENVGFKIVCRDMPAVLKRYVDLISNYDVDTCSIHIRRGDYFLPKNIKTFGVCDARYFNNSIEYILNLNNKIKFFIFSDDIEWVKQNVKIPLDSVIVENYEVPQLAYIELMSLCNHHIISNSTFSWWGSVINEHNDGIVVAPEKWVLTSNHTIALDKWHKIKV